MKNGLLLVAVSSFSLFGCSTLNVSQPSSQLVSNVEAPLKADLKVGQRISGTAKTIQILGLFDFGPNKFADGVNYGTGWQIILFDTFSAIKAAAAYEAISTSHADVIIAPRYAIDTKNYFLFKTTIATVSGYKGTLNSVSNHYPETTEVIKISAPKLNQVPVAVPVPVPEKNIKQKKK